MKAGLKKSLMLAFAAAAMATGGCSQVMETLPESTPAADATLAETLSQQQDSAVAFIKCTNGFTGEVLGSGVARGEIYAEGSRFGIDTLTYTDYVSGQPVTISARLRNAFTCNVQGVEMKQVAGGAEAIIADTTQFVAKDSAGKVVAADTTASSGVAFSVSRYTDQLDWERNETGRDVSPQFVKHGTTIIARGAKFNS